MPCFFSCTYPPRVRAGGAAAATDSDGVGDSNTPRGPQVGLTITKGTAGQPTPAKSAALLRKKVAAFSASPVLYPLLLTFATKCALPGGRIPSGGPALG